MNKREEVILGVLHLELKKTLIELRQGIKNELKEEFKTEIKPFVDSMQELVTISGLNVITVLKQLQSKPEISNSAKMMYMVATAEILESNGEL